MLKTFVSPARYVQGRGAINDLGLELKSICKKALVLCDPFVMETMSDTLRKNLKESEVDALLIEFAGDSTKQEVNRIADIAKENNVDLVVGIGGGKTLDAAKGAGAFAGVDFVTVPTIASNDSPTSSFTAWYDENGACLGFDGWGKNPRLVLVDSQIIANAPSRAFKSGMGDALATWIEARACEEGRSTNCIGGRSTMAAQALAKLGYDTLLECGESALRDVELNLVTPAVEKVIESNILLSGLGFESGGCATAHMIGNSLPSFQKNHAMTHGENVAFGILVQLCLEDNRRKEEVIMVTDFLISIGLPVTLEALGLKEIKQEELQAIADICAGEGSLCHCHPFVVTAPDVLDAIISADALGKSRLTK